MPLILPGNVASATAGGYEVANSCRFNFADSATLKRTPSSASNRTTWTWSGWVKRCKLGSIQVLFNARIGNFPENMYFDGDDKFRYHHDIAGSDYKLISSRVFRDVSSWYHIVIAKDTTDSTEANRVKVYVNGTQITMNEDGLGYPAQDFEGAVNDDEQHMIGDWCTDAGCNSNFIGGYLAEITFIDGLQLAASSFGEFDEDSPTIWKPKNVSGLTFGTNGFYLDFEDSSALGNDVSGNNNDLTVTNLAATDQATDTPTNNFCVQNSVATSIANAPAFSQGNLTLTASGNWKSTIGTFALTSGKWYFETWGGGGTSGTLLSGIASTAVIEAGGASNGVNNNFTIGVSLPAYAYHGSSGAMYRSDTSGNGLDQGGGSWGTAYDSDDIISVYIDLDNHKLYTAKNDTMNVSGTGVSIATGYSYYPGAIPYSVTQSINYGIGSFNGTAVSSAVADANGYGAFEYDPSRGGASDFDSAAKDFYAICTKNLAEFGG